jgi:hypothetical protein
MAADVPVSSQVSFISEIFEPSAFSVVAGYPNFQLVIREDYDGNL